MKQPIKKNKKPKDVLNEKVVESYAQIRVIGDDGRNLGVFDSAEVMEAAKAKGLDLLLLSAKANPPTCKLLDYNRHKYILEKSIKERGGAPKQQQQKEIMFRANIAEGDLANKLSKCAEFLADGHRVKVMLRFRGRQMAHQEVGFDIMQRIRESLECKVMQEPKLVNNTISMLLTPA